MTGHPGLGDRGVEAGEERRAGEGADEAGEARMLTVRQSTLPSLWWEKPDTSEVPISEKWTAAEAAAGATPAASSRVEDVTP